MTETLRPAPALVVDHLSKTFDGRMVVNDLSFFVEPGEIVGLVGLNGAGKTTTINMILGVLAPTSGSVTIAGVNLGAHARRPSPAPISPRSTRLCPAI